MKPKCLIIEDMHPSIFPLLNKKGYEVNYFPDISPDQVFSIISNYEVLFIRSKMFIGRELLEKAKRLKCICRAGSGMDIIDTRLAEKKGIKLINSPEGNRDAVGEHTLGILLCLMNKMNLGNQQIRNYIWNREENRGTELYGKCVGIIGYGNMGKSFAQRLAGFNCEVIAYDKYLKKYSDKFAKECHMNEIFKRADLLSLHIPLTEETLNLINHKFLERFKKSIWFINTSRGQIVKLKDLIYHIKNGKILGAGLDVLENEKLETLTPSQKREFKELIKLPNVLLTPHIAGWTHESYRKINVVLVGKLPSIDY